jgi:prepilin-type N-terminal cleavage/methylation domain-containing protein
MERRKGFTLIELMVVILIVSILAGVAIPLMQGRIDSAKWSEANAAAGTVRTAVRAYHAEKGATASAALVNKALNDSDTQAKLGFNSADLTGTYFAPSNYTISAVNSDGIAEVTVTAGTGLTGTYKLLTNGEWQKQASSGG